MIKLLTSMAGDRFSYIPGQVVSLDSGEEKRLIEKGLAEKVNEKKPRKSARK